MSPKPPTPEPELNNKPWYENGIIQAILRIGGLITAITVIIKLSEFIVPYNLNDIIKNSANIKLTLEALNFMVLMIFCFYSIKVPILGFKDPEHESIENYNAHLSIAKDHKDFQKRSKSNSMRVNILAKQLNDNIIFYALTLMVVYLVFFLEGTGIIPANYSDYATGVIDIFNFLSAIFLFLAFKVLYDKTLDDNNRGIIYYMDALFLSFFYILIYILLFRNDDFIKIVCEKKVNVIINDLGLFSGIVNGLAMSLLFSRFISMEHNFLEIFDNPLFKSIKKYRKLLYFGTIFLLPLYAVIQPLFGNFDFTEFGDSKIFESMVFLICFFGKLFFLILFSLYMKNKLIHLYFHIVITKHGVPNDLITCFNFKDDQV
jgi:hypothetical protein